MKSIFTVILCSLLGFIFISSSANAGTPIGCLKLKENSPERIDCMKAFRAKKTEEIRMRVQERQKARAEQQGESSSEETASEE